MKKKKKKTLPKDTSKIKVDEPIDHSNLFKDLSMDETSAILRLLEKGGERDAFPRISKNKKSLIRELKILDKIYNILKSLIESKSLSESEKERLNNEIEVISLRLKGKNKIIIKKPDYEEGLKFFQKALELSSLSQQEISKTDLTLVKKIFEQQNKKTTLHYLNEISDHTLILIDEIIISSQFLIGRISDSVIEWGHFIDEMKKKLSQLF